MVVEFGADGTADRYAGQTDLIADLQAVGTSKTGVKRIIVAAFRMLDFFPLRGKENGSTISAKATYRPTLSDFASSLVYFSCTGTNSICNFYICIYK